MYTDTSGLSFQLMMYRWEDDMRSARAARLREADSEAADLLIAQYNDLVRRYNILAEAAVKAGQAADSLQARVGAAEAELLSKNREIADLKQRHEAELYSVERSREFWIRETERCESRALAAEAELKAFRSLKD